MIQLQQMVTQLLNQAEMDGTGIGPTPLQATDELPGHRRSFPRQGMLSTKAGSSSPSADDRGVSPAPLETTATRRWLSLMDVGGATRERDRSAKNPTHASLRQLDTRNGRERPFSASISSNPSRRAARAPMSQAAVPLTCEFNNIGASTCSCWIGMGKRCGS